MNYRRCILTFLVLLNGWVCNISHAFPLECADVLGLANEKEYSRIGRKAVSNRYNEELPLFDLNGIRRPDSKGIRPAPGPEKKPRQKTQESESTFKRPKTQESESTFKRPKTQETQLTFEEDIYEFTRLINKAKEDLKFATTIKGANSIKIQVRKVYRKISQKYAEDRNNKSTFQQRINPRYGDFEYEFKKRMVLFGK
jgi:hypothetical protein